ncbi:unnamed protein product [Larinioides sclopetarius]|uniref:Uncharacterized protein n=1 Tax=Larinioides sclopetarius TaxID=280406 RepID=A0AAV1ZDY5_9ARAC
MTSVMIASCVRAGNLPIFDSNKNPCRLTLQGISFFVVIFFAAQVNEEDEELRLEVKDTVFQLNQWKGTSENYEVLIVFLESKRHLALTASALQGISFFVVIFFAAQVNEEDEELRLEVKDTVFQLNQWKEISENYEVLIVFLESKRPLALTASVNEEDRELRHEVKDIAFQLNQWKRTEESYGTLFFFFESKRPLIKSSQENRRHWKKRRVVIEQECATISKEISVKVYESIVHHYELDKKVRGALMTKSQSDEGRPKPGLENLNTKTKTCVRHFRVELYEKIAWLTACKSEKKCFDSSWKKLWPIADSSNVEQRETKFFHLLNVSQAVQTQLNILQLSLFLLILKLYTDEEIISLVQNKPQDDSDLVETDEPENVLVSHSVATC